MKKSTQKKKRRSVAGRRAEHEPTGRTEKPDEYVRLFRLLADNAREMVSRHAVDLTFLYASPASVHVIGHASESLIGYRLDDLTHPDDLSSVLSTFAVARDTGDTSSTVFRCRAPGRTWRWCELFCRGIAESDSGTEEIHATIRDVSKYKQIEKAIKRVAREWRSTFDSAHDAIVMLDRQANVLRVNLATLRLLECEFKDLVGQPLTEITKKRLDLDDPFRIESVWTSKSQVRNDVELKDRSIWLRSTVDPILTEADRIDGAVVFISNITAEKQAELSLLTTLDEVRELTAHLQTVREEERRSIAREVHDELGHALTALKMNISWLVKRIPQGDEELATRGTELTGLVDQTISSMRRIVSRLRPPVLDDLGLDAALEWLAADFQRYSGVETRIEMSDIPERYRGVNASCIFRIVQEALTNVSKHAQASRVSIHGQLEGSLYRLVVMDDGQGFEIDVAERQPGFGLLGIAERVRELEGELEIDSRPGSGSRLMVTLPRDALQ